MYILERIPILMIFALILGCQAEQRSPAMDDYDLSPLGQKGWYKAIQKNIDDQIIETGYFLNGQKAHSWISYDEEGKNISKITPYISGEINGAVIKLDKNGQLIERAHFENDQLNGYYEKYEFGKKKMTAYYEDGQLHGRVTKYINYTGKLLSEADYKNGKLHGTFRHYDDQGRVTLEYKYEDGEKVEGGIVNENETNTH